MFRMDPSVICPWDPDAKDYAHMYWVKYELAKAIQPGSMVEIGVRAGYSAWAFLQACPSMEYRGFDANNGEHCGTSCPNGKWTDWARKILSGYDALIHDCCDTQTTSVMPSADAYHVDGDHTEEGCLHDMEICASGMLDHSVMVVDDYTMIPDVRRAVDGWLGKRPEFEMVLVEGFRGDAVMGLRSHERVRGIMSRLRGIGGE